MNSVIIFIGGGTITGSVIPIMFGWGYYKRHFVLTCVGIFITLIGVFV